MTSGTVKPLNFLVRVCCSCNRIQTDDGHWFEGDELLELISGNRRVITHGVCPGCLRKLYPDIADHVLNKNPTEAY
jgi:hypothetical protein